MDAIITPLAELLLGKIFEELCEVVKETIKKVKAFEPELEEIKRTLVRLKPLVEKIDQLSQELGGTPNETRPLIENMEEGKKLVNECSKVKCWEYCKKRKYTKVLRKFAESLRRYMQIEVQAQQLRDIKQILHKLDSMEIASTLVYSFITSQSAEVDDVDDDEYVF